MGMKPSFLPLPDCVTTPGTMSGFHPRRMPACFQSGGVMTFQEDIAALQIRIAKAESERDSWGASGMQEKYLEAYSMVDALELQLEQLQAARMGVRP